MLGKLNFKRSRNTLEKWAGDATQNVPGVPDAMCVRCPGCARTIFSADMESEQYLCSVCGHHFRMSARKRIALMCDENSFEERDAALHSADPLEFSGYEVKLKIASEQSGEEDAVLCGTARINGYECAVFAMSGDFMMGSMGGVVGEKLTRLFESAIELGLPVVGFTTSGGARMQEGILSLMQMAKVSGAVKRHSDAGLLFVAVLCDPTTGGVTASFAMEGDILLSEPGALIGFAGPRVIEQTMRQKLPKGFQRAEFLLEKGFLDAVIPRTRMKVTLAQILRLHNASKKEEESV